MTGARGAVREGATTSLLRAAASEIRPGPEQATVAAHGKRTPDHPNAPALGRGSGFPRVAVMRVCA